MKSPGASCPGALQKRAEATGGSLAVSIDLRVSTPVKTAPFPMSAEKRFRQLVKRTALC